MLRPNTRTLHHLFMQISNRKRREYRSWLMPLFVIALVFAIAAPASAQTACGDFNDDGVVTATDALGALGAAVGINSCAMSVCDVNDDGTVSATDALTLLGSAVGQPVTLDCPGGSAAICVNDDDFFFQQVWSPILTDCIACHQSAGVAASTRYVLTAASQPDYLTTNYEVIRALTDESVTPGGRTLFLSKPLGVSHYGGQRLGMTEASTLHQNLVELVDRFDTPVACETSSSADFYAGLSNQDWSATLRRAAILFAGRLPTDSERATVASGNESTLRQTIRSLMQGDDFDAFLMEAANDQIHTDGLLYGNMDGFAALGSEYSYPHLLDRVNEAGETPEPEDDWLTYERMNRSLAREPLRLIAHVANNERPWSEVLTADYMMVNPYSGSIYVPDMVFPDRDDFDDWREVTNEGYRLPNFPHAGILSSPIFLNRYPSSASNRNRRRSRYTWRFFLGVDIESLAPRTSDPAILNTENPTLNNVNCTVCHTVMDPIAGAFQNWDDMGQFRISDNDSLPWTYKGGDLYQWGDLWYRDMRSPGFNGLVMPSSENDHSLQWLAAQIVNDQRFPRGAVEFWWPGMFGRSPTARPTDVDDPSYAETFAAWSAEQDEIDRLAGLFADGAAGTAANGALNIKDLLLEMLMSPLMTATRLTGSEQGETEQVYAGAGRERLLTPEQLDRKVASVTGQVWAPDWDPTWHELLERYRYFYGGIDSDGNIARAERMNAMMSTVVERLANEMACRIVVYEFSALAGSRTLFPYVEPDTTPAVDEQAFRNNVVLLHDRFLGETLSTNDAEVDRTIALFEEIRALRIAQNRGQFLSWGGSHCNAPFWQDETLVSGDPDHVMRGWTAVLAYLLGDYKFLHE